MKKRCKRSCSLALAMLMLLTMTMHGLAGAADGAWEDGLCAHHLEHTQDCGYAPAVDAQACGHVHDDACGYTAAVPEVLCNMGCSDQDGDGVPDHAAGCAYAPAVDAQACGHVHDDACGYAAAQAEQPCRYDCTVCSGDAGGDDGNVTAVDDAAALVQAFAAAPADGTQTVIQVTADLDLAEKITVRSGQNIRLQDDGVLRTLTAAHSDTVFFIESGAVFTLAASAENKLIVDGALRSAPQQNNSGKIVSCRGRFVLDGAVIQNALSYGNYAGVVHISGEDAVFELKAGEIRNNIIDGSNTSAFNASVYAASGAKIVISGGRITGNTTEGSDNQRYVTAGVLAYNGSGDVTVEMTGGEISHNTSSTPGDGGGGVWLCGSAWNWSYYTRMTMSGGTICDNTADYCGGGVFVYGLASLHMTGGTVANNTVTSGMGGGVCVFDGLKGQPAMSDALIVQYSTAYRLGSFTLDGGTITGNEARRGSAMGDGGCGGGVYIATMNALLRRGTVSGNTAGRQGGGIYVGSTPYVLKMVNTVIKENTASILGGGLWFCPTGDVTSVVTNGSAIYDNTASPADASAGDDIAIVPQGDTHYADLSIRMLGGGQVAWYRDGGITGAGPSGILGDPDFSEFARYDASGAVPVTEISGKQEGLAVKCIASDAVKALAESQAALWVTGNHSERGGGVGSNGGVIIGVPDQEYTLTVTKDWGNTPPAKQVAVTVNLKIGSYVLDGVTLSAANHWTASFTGLPDPASLDNAEITVEEVVPAGFTASYSQVSIDTSGKTLSITVTNESEPEPDPGPDPTPTGSLTISKTVTGETADRNRKFTFTVTFVLDDGTVPGQRFPYNGDISGSIRSGESIALAHGEQVTITGIPVGTAYTVTEEAADADGYTVDPSGGVITGTIAKGGATAAFTNSHTDETAPPDEPDPPMESDGPDVPDVPDTPDDPHTPQTGDASMSWLWALLCAASLVGLAVTTWGKKRFCRGKHIQK